MSEELKPCAHCGGRGEMDQFSPDAMDEWRVICADKSCEAWGPEASTRDAAITAWNRRVPAWRPIAEAERDAIVAWLRAQSEKGADIALEHEKGTTTRSAFGGGSLALKKAADEIEIGNHLPAAPADGGK